MNQEPILQSDEKQLDVPVMDEQTTFAEEQPLFDSSHAADVNAKLPKKKNTYLVVIGVSVGIFLLIFALALLTMKKQLPISVQPTPTPMVEQQTASQSAMQKTLNLLHDDVLRADPRTNDLPFPPVNFELYIQPKQ